ncbi:MAG: class D sortase [Culicoidibacterales bacterium]
MIRKIVGTSLLLVGLVLMGVGGYQLYTAYQAETSSLGEAKALIETVQEQEQAKPDAFADSDIIGIVSIERLGFESAIVEGVNDADLIKGAGHMSETALPGEGDKIVLAGHRNQAFGKLEGVEVGDEVKVQTIYGEYRYLVREMEVIDETQTEILLPTAPKEELVLFTCYPFVFGAPTQQRYVVYADLIVE